MAAVYKSVSKTSSLKPTKAHNGTRKNKQRVLILCSRGVTYRHRHLLNDLASMLPHSRKEAKFDSKSRLNELNELAELYNCNNVLFFEARKGKDLYLWLSKAPNGPTIKMHLQNLHTMEELHFTGNCLKGSRPLLSFDAAFEQKAHLRVIKELFLHSFGIPQGARKSKPFIDHVMGFSFVDGKIWLRHYQISEEEPSVAKPDDWGAELKAADEPFFRTSNNVSNTDIRLIEIGPRFVLTPIVIQEGSFGGPIIYENREFISPNQIRADLRKAKASRHNARAEKLVERSSKKSLGLNSGSGRTMHNNDLDSRKLFA